MNGVFLRDWQPGDVVTADDMQALVDAVAMLEGQAALPAVAARPRGGGVRRVGDGPQGWPWQVYEAGGVLRVVRGEVLTGVRFAAQGDGADDGVYEYAFLGLPDGDAAEVVQEFDSAADVVTVWLELTGGLVLRALSWDEVLPPGDDRRELMSAEELAAASGYFFRGLEGATLRVTCRPVEGALRVWPLAVVTRGHEQPVNQLLWGELSALECRGLATAEGRPVWPTDRSGAAAWGTRAHAAGMDVLAAVDFSTEAEVVAGELYGCMDVDGAVELYLGGYEPGGSAAEGEGEADEEEEEEEEDVVPPGPYVPPGGDDDDGEGPGGVTWVKYGYVAGEGFLGCELVRAADGQLYWVLELDPDFLAGVCAGLEVPVTVTYCAGGTQQGSTATVEMGLGECAASVTGMLLQGTAELVFHGSNDVDASKKSATVKVNYEASPVWRQERKWYLSPKKLHQAGAYVKLEKASNGWQAGGFVEAMAWYRFSVKREEFRKNALACLKKEMAAISVDGETESTSEDSSVRAVLSGTLTAPVYTMTLGDATE